MATVREETQNLTRVLNEKRTRLIQEVREVERILDLLDYLNTNNHQLRMHIKSTNRRQRGGQSQESHKRVHSPTFSEQDEEEGEINKFMRA